MPRPASNDPLDPLVQAGTAWTIRAVIPLRYKAPIAFGAVGPALLLGAVGTSIVLYRATTGVTELALSYPRTFRGLHYPWVGPMAAIGLGYGLGLAAPLYLAGTQELRPDSWPDVGTMTVRWGASLAFCGVALALAGAAVALSRIGREGKSFDNRADSRWAGWGDVAVSPNWSWVVPMRVHYRGTKKPWKRGSGKTVLAPEDTDTHRHILLVGQTGSGKGFTVFSPIIASSKVPVVYQDVKAQAPGIDILRKKLGVEPLRWGAAGDGGWPSMCWNPMEEARNDVDPAAAFAALAAALIPGHGEDDWVAQLARPILAWVLQMGGFQTLAEVQDALLHRGVEKIIMGAGVPQGLLAALEGKNVKEYLGTTIFSAMSCFRAGWGREVTSRHDFSLDDVCKNGIYVFSAEPEVTQRTPLVLFWRMLLRKLLRSTKPVPLNLLFDEALAAGKISNVRDALATLRDREVSIVFGTQHLSGLKEVYGQSEGESLIASFSARIFLLSGLDPRDREYLTKSLGQFTVQERKDRPPASVDLLRRDDLNRRANMTQYVRVGKKIKKSPVFWAVIDGPGFTVTGDAVMAKMEGFGGSGLIRRPTVEEVEAEASVPQILQPAVTPTEEEVQVIETKQEAEEMVLLCLGEAAMRILERHPELMEAWKATGTIPRWAWNEEHVKGEAKSKSNDVDIEW